jgi:hypothetical protein
MKKLLTYIGLFFITLIVSNCDTNDDTFYKTIYLDVTTSVVQIQTQPTYNVGDFLYVNASIPRLITETGQTNLLDIYKTTNANQLAFSYVIERRIDAENWQVVTVNDSQLDINEGIAQNGFDYIYSVCEYDSTDEIYKYNVGFPLLSIGNYRLSFGNSASLDKVEIISLSSPKDLVVNMNTAATGITNGYYNFTVN